MRLPEIIEHDGSEGAEAPEGAPAAPVDDLQATIDANAAFMAAQFPGMTLAIENAAPVEGFFETYTPLRPPVDHGHHPNSLANLRPGNPGRKQSEIKGAVKVLIGEIVAGNLENVHLWIARGAVRKPLVAAKLVIELAEFILPKLARTEHTGEGGGPVIIKGEPQDRHL